MLKLEEQQNEDKLNNISFRILKIFIYHYYFIPFYGFLELFFLHNKADDVKIDKD